MQIVHMAMLAGAGNAILSDVGGTRPTQAEKTSMLGGSAPGEKVFEGTMGCLVKMAKWIGTGVGWVLNLSVAFPLLWFAGTLLVIVAYLDLLGNSNVNTYDGPDGNSALHSIIKAFHDPSNPNVMYYTSGVTAIALFVATSIVSAVGKGSTAMAFPASGVEQAPWTQLVSQTVFSTIPWTLFLLLVFVATTSLTTYLCLLFFLPLIAQIALFTALWKRGSRSFLWAMLFLDMSWIAIYAIMVYGGAHPACLNHYLFRH
jgi:hypothetical protein